MGVGSPSTTKNGLESASCPEGSGPQSVSSTAPPAGAGRSKARPVRERADAARNRRGAGRRGAAVRRATAWSGHHGRRRRGGRRRQGDALPPVRRQGRAGHGPARRARTRAAGADAQRPAAPGPRCPPGERLARSSTHTSASGPAAGPGAAVADRGARRPVPHRRARAVAAALPRSCSGAARTGRRARADVLLAALAAEQVRHWRRDREIGSATLATIARLSGAELAAVSAPCPGRRGRIRRLDGDASSQVVLGSLGPRVRGLAGRFLRLLRLRKRTGGHSPARAHPAPDRSPSSRWATAPPPAKAPASTPPPPTARAATGATAPPTPSSTRSPPRHHRTRQPRLLRRARRTGRTRRRQAVDRSRPRRSNSPRWSRTTASPRS